MADTYELGRALLDEHSGKKITVGEVIRTAPSGPGRAALETLVSRHTISRDQSVDDAADDISFELLRRET